MRKFRIIQATHFSALTGKMPSNIQVVIFHAFFIHILFLFVGMPVMQKAMKKLII